MKCLLGLLLVAIASLSCSKTDTDVDRSVTSISSQERPEKILGYASKTVELNKLTFSYVEAGAGDVMIFLHGFPYFGAAWDKLLKPMSASYHVVAPDNRGYGYTDKPHDLNEYKINKLVGDVKAMISTLSPNRKVIIVGHDWGGVLAWGLAQQHPELVSKVIVINAPPFNAFLDALVNSESQRKASSYIAKITSWKAKLYFAFKGTEVLWSDGMSKLVAEGHIDESFKNAFFDSWAQENSVESAVNWYKANFPAFEHIDNSSFWPSKTGANSTIEIPSLLIWSKHDKAFTDDTFNEISKYVTQLEVKVIDTDSHSPFLDHTDEVLESIRQFISK
jgi:pimeloyl-ACP methyl ester carboxylesterase